METEETWKIPYTDTVREVKKGKLDKKKTSVKDQEKLRKASISSIESVTSERNKPTEMNIASIFRNMQR